MALTGTELPLNIARQHTSKSNSNGKGTHVNEDGKRRYEETMRDFLSGHLSRAQLLKAAGIGAALVAVPGVAMADTTTAPAVTGTGSAALQFPNLSFFPSPSLTKSGTYTTENVNDILNIAQTAEYFAVTFLTAALNNAGTIGLTGLTLEIVQAILAAEILHVQFLTAVGATPLTTNFTIPDPTALTDFTTFFKNVEAADTIFVGAYLAAIREFAELGQPQLSKIAAQFMGVEAEHRVLARAALATAKNDAASIPPNNKGYETDLFLYVREAAALLEALGFVGGTGAAAAFPGLAAATTATGGIMIIQTSPNSAAEGSTTTTNITAAH